MAGYGYNIVHCLFYILLINTDVLPLTASPLRGPWQFQPKIAQIRVHNDLATRHEV